MCQKIRHSGEGRQFPATARNVRDRSRRRTPRVADHDLGDRAAQRILRLALRWPIVPMQHDPAGPHQPGNGCAGIKGGLIASLQHPPAPAEEGQAGLGSVLDNLAVEDIAQIEHARDFCTRRPGRQLVWWPLLERASPVQDDDTIGKRRGFLEIVRYQHDRYA